MVPTGSSSTRTTTSGWRRTRPTRFVVDPTGEAIAKFGDFDGITRDGAARGLLFPASLVFSRDKRVVYVTNLALDLRLFELAQSVDSQWIAKVKRFTVSKLEARIPPF